MRDERRLLLGIFLVVLAFRLAAPVRRTQSQVGPTGPVRTWDSLRLRAEQNRISLDKHQ